MKKELDDSKEENTFLLRTNKAMKIEIEKMKQRIIKIKNRKGKIDLGIKQCKVCHKEYDEKTNFRWSCRTHFLEYSGT